MFRLNDTKRYHLCPGRTDMRKGINSLIRVVREQMGSDVRNGDLFIFIGGSRRLMKLLHAEDDGMVMYVKRLEAGRFRLPKYDTQTRGYSMEWHPPTVPLPGSLPQTAAAAPPIPREGAEERKRRESRLRAMMDRLLVLKTEVIEPEGGSVLTRHRKIGEEVTRTLECEPGRLYVKETIRPK